MEPLSKPPFVDVHTHVVPSGDDGATTVEDGIELCRAAAASGTRVLFATPHMHADFDQFPWSERRERLYEAGLETLRAAAADFGVELRAGREVYPTVIGNGSLEHLRLEGTRAVLVEFPGSWLSVDEPLRATWRACERLEAAGLVPILAHPERCAPITAHPERALPFADRGWLLCPNGGSFLGEHGPGAEKAAWNLVERGAVAIVASDAHRSARPPHLDVVHDAIAARVGVPTADAVLDGRAVPWDVKGEPGRQT